MSTGEPSWDLFGSFLAVLETGSLSGASRALGVAQPTVRRQIEALEQQLGVVLFTRAANGLVPTATAHATLPYAQAIASAARAFVRAATNTAEQGGTIRLACSEIVAVEVLPPLLAGMEQRIELAVSNRNEDLLRRDADIAIRMIRPTQVGLVAQRIGDVRIGLYATRAYLDRRGTPTRPAQLAEHALIGGDRERAVVEALNAAGAELRPRDLAVRTDNHAAQLAAVRAGLGIGVCQERVARGLVRVLPKLQFPLEMWVVMHEDLRASPQVKRAFDHLVTALRAYMS